MTPASLIDRLKEGDGADWRLDACVWAICNDRTIRTEGRMVLAKSKKPPFDECVLVEEGREIVPGFNRYTSSLDACVDLIGKVLPGWWWSCGLCVLSGDGSVMVNHASLGPDFRAGPPDDIVEKFDTGFHNDLRPGDGISRVCRALLCCLIEAKTAVDEFERSKTG